MKLHPPLSLASDLPALKNNSPSRRKSNETVYYISSIGDFAFVHISTGLCCKCTSAARTPPAPTPRGFSTLLCVADALLVGGASLSTEGDTITLFGGKVLVEAISNVTPGAEFSTIDVRITHGNDFSEHTVRFIDSTEPFNTLNCGDTILAVF